jgi:hypothetical protein
MDVWTAPRRSLRGEAAPYEYGATLRFFDPAIQAWRSTWIGPVRHLVRPFVARQIGDEIVLEGRFAPGSLTRWIFSDIAATSFHWRNMEASAENGPWILIQEMHARRAEPESASIS